VEPPRSLSRAPMILQCASTVEVGSPHAMSHRSPPRRGHPCTTDAPMRDRSVSPETTLRVSHVCRQPSPVAALPFTSPTLSIPSRHGNTSACQQNSPRVESQDAWSVMQTLRLGSTLEHLPSIVPRLDISMFWSIGQAVDALNRGLVTCQEDFCAAYSASSKCFYLLYRAGREEAARAAIGARAQTMITTLSNASQAPPDKLAIGVMTQIGDHVYKIIELLGTGSFGTVWGASQVDGECDVAIKEVFCRSHSQLICVRNEAKLLQQITERNKDVGCPLSQVPSLIADATQVLGEKSWCVRLVMTRVPGVQLSKFVEKFQKDRIASNRAASHVANPLQQFKEACHFARELTLQLAHIFEFLSPLVYHRDINTHNILVAGDVSNPRFGLVDFGLAVNAERWRGQMSSSSWHLVDIGGDARYWPMSAWLQFECGWHKVAKYPSLTREYQTHLDLHALGITIVQILLDMCPASGNNSNLDVGVCHELAQKVLAVRLAWTRYWDDVSKYWAILIDVFRNNGDQNALKKFCIAEQVHNVVGADLASLRRAINEVAGTSSHVHPSIDLTDIKPIFFALLEIFRVDATDNESGECSTWRSIQSLVRIDEKLRDGFRTLPVHRMLGWRGANPHSSFDRARSGRNHFPLTEQGMPVAVA